MVHRTNSHSRTTPARAPRGAAAHLCATRGAAAQNRAGVANWEQHLRGRVAWAEQLNPRKAARLRRLLAAIDWTS
ncbi:MAG: hypothetical protein JF586_09860 [Burkholderiales bacterium]|nr:hypothetical protein [Burkholderiales bacterium]